MRYLPTTETCIIFITHSRMGPVMESTSPQEAIPLPLPPGTLQTTIIADPKGNLVISRDKIPVPLVSALQPDQLLVKVHVVALNPADVKLTDEMACPGAVAGHDLAGVVVAVGGSDHDIGDTSTSKGRRRRFRPGDRICTATVPMNSLNPSGNGGGAFDEYVVVVADFALHIPDAVSMHEAASLGIGLATRGYGNVSASSRRSRGGWSGPLETTGPDEQHRQICQNDRVCS